MPKPTASRPLRLALVLALVSAEALASVDTPAPSPPRRAFDVVVETTIEDIRKSCAAIVDDVWIPHVERPQASLTCRGFRYDLDDYLATRGRHAPVRILKDLFVSGRFGPTIRKRLEHAMDARSHGPDSEGCKAKRAYREA